MKNLILTISSFITCIFLSSPAFTQIAGNAVYNSNTIYQLNQGGVDLGLNNYSYSFSNVLEANVMVNIKASSYVAIFSLTQHGKTVEEAEAAMHNRIEIFKALLQQDNSLKIFIDPVSLVPAYEIEVTEKKFSKTFNELPTGFEIKKNVHITFNDHNQVNHLIAIAAKAEVYDLVKVDYVVDDLETVIDGLRQEALKILMNKKATFERAGMHLRFLQLGEKYGSVYPIERYAQYYAYKTGMAPDYTISYKKGQPQQQVQYNYAEKNKTIYYEKVSDKQFDKVINPVAGEPMVQVYFSIKGQYQFYNPETEAAEKTYSDKMKQLQQEEMELNLQEKRKDIELKTKQKDKK